MLSHAAVPNEALGTCTHGSDSRANPAPSSLFATTSTVTHKLSGIDTRASAGPTALEVTRPSSGPCVEADAGLTACLSRLSDLPAAESTPVRGWKASNQHPGMTREGGWVCACNALSSQSRSWSAAREVTGEALTLDEQREQTLRAARRILCWILQEADSVLGNAAHACLLDAGVGACRMAIR